MRFAPVSRVVGHRRPAADLATRRNREETRLGIVGLRYMFLAHVVRCEYGHERSRGRRLLHTGTPLRLFALDSANYADDLKSKFARRLDCLNRRSPGCADIVHDHHARALLSEALDALSCTVLLLGLAHEEAVEFPAHHRNRDDNRVGAHGQPADGLGPPSTVPDFLEEYFSSQPRPLRIERGGAAVDVVIAHPARRKFELAQLKRLVGECGKQLLPRGMHKKLRYHAVATKIFNGVASSETGCREREDQDLPS